MTGNKPWYQSKTMIGLVATAVTMVLGFLKLDVSKMEVSEIITQLVAVGGLIFAAYGRAKAKTKLGGAPKAKRVNMPLLLLLLLPLCALQVGCFNAEKVTDAPSDGALVGSSSLESATPSSDRGPIANTIQMVRDRALFGFGFANKNGRVYAPFYIGWDTGPIAPDADSVDHDDSALRQAEIDFFSGK